LNFILLKWWQQVCIIIVVLVRRRSRQKSQRLPDVTKPVPVPLVNQSPMNPAPGATKTLSSVFYPDISKHQRPIVGKPPTDNSRPPTLQTYTDVTELKPNCQDSRESPVVFANAYSDLRTHRRQYDTVSFKPTPDPIIHPAPKHRPTLTSKIAPMSPTQAPVTSYSQQNPLFRADLHLTSPSPDENV
jgi:hypothetical protein